MAYRPQFVQSPTPPGFVDEEFEYFFDSVNTPALGIVTPGQIFLKIPLQLQSDAEYIWRGIQVSGNTGSLQLRFWSPYGDELGAALVETDRYCSAFEQGNPPLGKLPVPLEPEIRCPASGFLEVDLLVL